MKITKIISNYPEKRIVVSAEDLKRVQKMTGNLYPVKNRVKNLLDYSPRTEDEESLVLKKGEISDLCRIISENGNYNYYKAFCVLRKIAVNSKAIINEEAERIISGNYTFRRPPSKAHVKHKTGKFIM